MIEDSAPYPAAGMHYIHDVIDPRETRQYILQALEISRNRRTERGRRTPLSELADQVLRSSSIALGARYSIPARMKPESEVCLEGLE